ncbi:4Fe-4S binding protein [Fusibacter sp. JL298sf-3]
MRKLLVLSGKGGTGKTRISAAIIKFSKTEVFADCDIDAPNLHLTQRDFKPTETFEFYGMPRFRIDADSCVNCGRCVEACTFNAVTAIDGQYTIDSGRCEGCGACSIVCDAGAVEEVPYCAGTQMLAHHFSTARLAPGRGNSGKLVTAVKAAIEGVSCAAPFSVYDGSPGIGCPVIASLSGIDRLLLVAEPSLSGIADLQRVLKVAETFRPEISVCINKWDINPELSRTIEAFCHSNTLDVAGKIPYVQSEEAFERAAAEVYKHLVSKEKGVSYENSNCN